MNDCVEWQHARDQYGYGRTGRNGKAHRVAWERANGPIPPGMVVMHLCDNPPCINLAHLRLGTQRENIQMAGDRGHLGKKGVAHRKARLTENDVRAIRLRANETKTHLAAEFGVHNTTIHDILRGRTWRHVPW